MARISRLILAIATLGLACSARAHTDPDPTEFLADLTAVAELCAARFPEMSDTPALLIANMNADDRKLYDDARRSTAFESAIAAARLQIANTPAEKLADMCKQTHDGLKQP